ncbi:MAG: glycosyltransferase family 4 protein [Candidatus Omnitrophota bacterium]
MSGKRLLVLNVEVSGINKYLMGQLEKRGWRLLVVNVPFPRIIRYLALFLTFRLPLIEWKKAFQIKQDRLYKTPWCFRWRSRQCEKILKEYQGRFDLILNISGMFAPSLKPIQEPYVTFNDYTMKLALKYPPWSPPEKDIAGWLELEKRLYKGARKIFVCSANTRRSMVRDYGIDPENIVMGGYGWSFEHDEDFSKDYDGKTILFVGYDFERKGGFALLEAFKKVRRLIPCARLVIIGAVKEIYRIRQDGVELLGPVADRDYIREAFRDASIFVMPSVCEPFGLVFLEAMGYKLPCIGANVDAMPEIIKDGETGFLVEPDDIGGLADKICLLLSDRKKMTEMGAKAFENVKNYTWDKVGTVIDMHLEEIVRDRQGSLIAFGIERAQVPKSIRQVPKIPSSQEHKASSQDPKFPRAKEKTWEPGNLGTWEPGNMGTREHGNLGTWARGYLDEAIKTDGETND